MNTTTPPKHKTPNYRLVGHPGTITNWIGQTRKITFWTWEPRPLRISRKDLHS